MIVGITKHLHLTQWSLCQYRHFYVEEPLCQLQVCDWTHHDLLTFL